MPYRIIAQYMQALLGLLNLAIGSPALATDSAVSAVLGSLGLWVFGSLLVFGSLGSLGSLGLWVFGALGLPLLRPYSCVRSLDSYAYTHPHPSFRLNLDPGPKALIP